jgi:hypothetical protein
MNPNTLEDDLSNGLGFDNLLAGCQNYHLRVLINDHEDIVITMLG